MGRRHLREVRVGDFVIYVMTKWSTHPGPRARQVAPAARGDTYSYAVDKQWVVDEVRGDSLVLRTRTGKVHLVSRDDPALRLPTLWERVRFRRRFPPAPDSISRTPAREA